MKEADEGEADDYGVYQNLGAVEMYTDAARDMDLIIGVWHKGMIKDGSMLKLSCLKSRENFFEPHLVQIDRRTRMVKDFPGAPTSEVSVIHARRAAAEDAALLEKEVAAGVY